MLEKVISTSPSKKISRDVVETVTGAPRAELVNSFVSSLIGKNANDALAVLGKTENLGVSIQIFLTLVLEKMRFILLAQHSVDSHTRLKTHISPDDWKFIENEAGKKQLTPKTLKILLESADSIGRASIEALPLELAVVEICQ
jgi:DNA polymerase III gamma/tau subunit